MEFKEKQPHPELLLPEAEQRLREKDTEWRCTAPAIIALCCLALCLLGVLSLLLPKPEISEYENRRLQERPEFSVYKLLSGELMGEWELYYADTFPAREQFVRAAGRIHESLGVRPDDVRIHSGSSQPDTEEPEPQSPPPSKTPSSSGNASSGAASSSSGNASSGAASSSSGNASSGAASSSSGNASSGAASSSSGNASSGAASSSSGNASSGAASSSSGNASSGAASSSSGNASSGAASSSSGNASSETASSSSGNASSGAASSSSGSAPSIPEPSEDASNWERQGPIFIYKGEGLSIFSTSETVSAYYAQTLNAWQERMGSDVTIYNLIIPTSIEFYLPERYRSVTSPQKPNIENIYSQLDPRIKTVDAYSAIEAHTDEYLYFRTDHHWTGRGAYYAYTAFCETAGLRPVALEDLERHTLTDFVGTLYKQAQDSQMLKKPDYVEYWKMPVDYTATQFRRGSPFYGIEIPLLGEYAKGGNSYSVFLHGDYPLTKIVTDNHNGRKIAMVKESFGNAFAPFLINNYEEVYVVDQRYFELNLPAFLEENGIHELLFINNIFAANTRLRVNEISRLMTQVWSPPPPEPEPEESEEEEAEEEDSGTSSAARKKQTERDEEKQPKDD